MIIEGSHFPFGTVLDEEEIPPNLRKPAYLTSPDSQAENFNGMEEINTEPTDLDDELDTQDYEEEIKPVRTAVEKRQAKFAKARHGQH